MSVLSNKSIHSNVMAGSLALLLPVGLARLLFEWSELKYWERLLLSAAVGAMAVILVLTKSRGGWIGCGIAVLILILLRWRRGWVVLLFSVPPVLWLVYLYGSQKIIEFLMATNTLGRLDSRMEAWDRALRIIWDFPLTGIGMGSYSEVVEALYPFALAAPGAVYHSHNLFLQVAVDLGLPALLAWMYLLGLVLWTAWKLYRYGKLEGRAWVSGLGAGLFASQVALVGHGLTDAVTWGMVRPAPLVWALWGLTLAAGLLFTDNPQKHV